MPVTLHQHLDDGKDIRGGGGNLWLMVHDLIRVQD